MVSGAAEVWVEGERGRVSSGGLALVPADALHEVHSVGEEPLRFFAVYAAADVVSRYEEEVQPGGSRERRPVA